MAAFVVRPSNSEKAPFRVHLTATSLLSLKLRPGDLCTLATSADHDGTAVSRTAIAWENSSTGMKDTVIQVSKFLQELYSFKLGDRINVQRSSEELKEASNVVLQSSKRLSVEQRMMWSFFASATVPSTHEILAYAQEIVIEVGSMKQEFRVVDVGGSLARVNKNTVFQFEHQNSIAKSDKLKLSSDGIGGLQREIEKVELHLKGFSHPRLIVAYPNLHTTRGILLYGPSGTGKSLLADTIARAGWRKVTKWMPGVKFENSGEMQLILIDFKTFAVTEKITADLVSLFDSARHTPTMVVGMSYHPNDISPSLRDHTAFSLELGLPVPNADQRLEILKIIRGENVQPTDGLLKDLANRTHGFVGGDLNKLMNSLMLPALAREDSESNIMTDQADEGETLSIMSADIEYALTEVQPSALREIIMEKPHVYWSDICGQKNLKEELQDAVEWPLKFRDNMKDLGLRPVKGILLYGPPGCSKTMIVKALATETDVNFIAVKGAELVSMYVGESERAIRDVFRKAKQASPSIIFFDEIDSIASRRRDNSDLNVLTTMLNEMDGFEELRDVLVVAATNKPDRIDPALIRSGRFDEVIYVGPPDFETRKKIFEKHFQKVKTEQEVPDKTNEFTTLTEGYSGAAVVRICESAGKIAFKAGRNFLTLNDVQLALKNSTKDIPDEVVRKFELWKRTRTT